MPNTVNPGPISVSFPPRTTMQEPRLS
uniref:Uncharacterized protein n=1 Tax=Rhizophora mucronata TaxID=61149 RepID=A0A2P2P7M2_RHIMU